MRARAAFPVSMARGASFDPSLEERIGDASAPSCGPRPWHLDANATDPHLPFGHGLDYTTFQIEQAQPEGDRVSVTVANSGPRSGSTVVQVYGTGSAHERPPKRLVGFAKVRLDAAESTEAAIAVDRSLLDLRIGGAWLREDLPVEYAIGFDAATARPI